MSTREQGTVSGHWRGAYSFLRPDGPDDTELFVHKSALEQVVELEYGQRVSFKRGTDKRGRAMAVSVRVEAS